MKLKSYILLFFSFFRYSVSRKTKINDIARLVHGYCNSGGYTNDILSILISFARPFSTPSSKLFPINSLIENGFIRSTSKSLNVDIEPLIELSTQIKAISDEDNSKSLINKDFVPSTSVYKYSELDLINSPQVQKILSSEHIYEIAGSYLHAKPCLDIVAMWWSFPGSEEYKKESAQSYHFDMDRIKWVKFFFYLTDVGLDSGPHCFIKGSHKTSNVPKDILSRGYSRIEDEYIYKVFGKDKEIIFTGLKGDVLIEDTRGLHKGLQPTSGRRLLFQLQFTNSLFGAPPRPSKIDMNFLAPELISSTLYKSGGLKFYLP